MRFLPVLSALVFLVAHDAVAEPRLSVNWSGCPASNPPRNRRLVDGPVATVVISAHGFTAPVQAVQVILGVSHAGMQGLPDSWRYDPAGCNAGGFQTTYAAAAGDCPSIVGNHPVSITKFDYNTFAGSATFAVKFDLRTLDPNATYTLVQFQFDHSSGFPGLGAKADSCGCVERAECLHILNASWLDQGQNEHPFLVDQDYVSWEDQFGSACGVADCFFPPCDNRDPCSLDQPTPAGARSWGRVKASYR